jgi:predicted AAA+ superfamily ATPase
MLENLVSIHNLVMEGTSTDFERYLYAQINWNAQAISIYGARGVGKTTLICQRLLSKYGHTKKALYMSLDNVHVLSSGLLNLATDFFNYGGEALFLDEVHKYPNWAVEIKNILDTFKKKQIIFSASSTIDLKKSKTDLSRRVVYHELKGLSFREYLSINKIIDMQPVSLKILLNTHVEICSAFTGISILKHFFDYLEYGFYPFFLEGVVDYVSKLSNVIEKVIFEDIAVVHNLKQTTLYALKKLLWLIATSDGLVPNIERISTSLQVSKEVVYNCIEQLNQADLVHILYNDGEGMKLIRKPGKIHLENTNILHAISGSLKLDNKLGNIREIFFINQLIQSHRVNLYDKGDFIVDGKYVFEVGGKGKTFKQIKNEQDAYLAVDGIESGFGKRIPLYLFGFLY